jgi:hypothetical protein
MVVGPPRYNPAPVVQTVDLRTGENGWEVKSHFNNVKIESPDSSTRVITLADGAVPADRDFELTWTAAAEKTPSVGLFRERVAGSDYARGDLCHRQFRLDGRHLDRPSQGRPALRARAVAAERPVQRHPFR